MFCVFVIVNPSEGGNRVRLMLFVDSGSRRCTINKNVSDPDFLFLAANHRYNIIRSHELFIIMLDALFNGIVLRLGCSESNKTAIVNVRIVYSCCLHPNRLIVYVWRLSQEI